MPDENVDSTTESDLSGAEWSGPQNQLGLDPEYLQQHDEVQLGSPWDDQVVALRKGEIKHHEAIVKYWNLT